MVEPSPDLLFCEHCDAVYRRRPLAAGEVAQCACCAAVLERHQRFGVDATLALVVTAMLVFLQANIWPIMKLGLNGQHVQVRLWDVIIMVWREHSPLVAVLVAAMLFFFPIAKMMMMALVFWQARRRRRGWGFREAMVGLHYLNPWTMSEVFVLGVMVAIVKARAYFDVTVGPGLYAYAVLMVLITASSGLDLRSLWDATEGDHA